MKTKTTKHQITKYPKAYKAQKKPKKAKNSKAKEDSDLAISLFYCVYFAHTLTDAVFTPLSKGDRNCL